jgi:D-hexose-6-phosphate mutarotase
MKNGVPLAWPWFGNWDKHGDEQNSIETWKNMTPELERKNIDLIRKAYERVTGHKCQCENR